jgi:hypothetical protein
MQFYKKNIQYVFPRTNVAVRDLQARHVIVDRFCPGCVVLHGHIFSLVVAIRENKAEINNVGNRQTEAKTPYQAQDTDVSFHRMMSVMTEDSKEGMIVHQILPKILLPVVSRNMVTTHNKVGIQRVS